MIVQTGKFGKKNKCTGPNNHMGRKSVIKNILKKNGKECMLTHMATHEEKWQVYRNSRDGTRVGTGTGKPGFLHGFWNPGFQIQNPETRVLKS